MNSRALRFVLEAAFIVAVALVLGLAHVRRPWIVGILVGAWLLTALAEAVAERSWGAVPLPPVYSSPPLAQTPPAVARAAAAPSAAATPPAAPAPVTAVVPEPWPGEEVWGGGSPVLPPAPAPAAPGWLLSAEALGVTLVGLETEAEPEPSPAALQPDAPPEPAIELESGLLAAAEQVPEKEVEPEPEPAAQAPAVELPNARVEPPVSFPAEAEVAEAHAPSLPATSLLQPGARQPLKLRTSRGRPYRRIALPAAPEPIEPQTSRARDRGRRIGQRWFRRLSRRREPERSSGNVRS